MDNTGLKKISASEFEQFNEHLRQLLAGDMPLAEGLQSFASEINDANFRAAVERVASKLKEGISIAEALDEQGGAFSPEYRGLIHAGEQSGDLLGVLDAALEHERYMAQFEEGLKRAIYYPAMVFAWTLLTFAVTMALGYSAFARLYHSAGQSLPLLFRILHLFYGPKGMFALFWVAALFYVLYLIRHRWGLGALALKIPFLKKVAAEAYTARLAKTLGLLLKSGSRPHDAMSLIAASTSDPIMRSRLGSAARRVAEGVALSSAVNIEGMEDTGFSDLIEIGEEAGTLPALLTEGAGLYRMEAQAKLEVALKMTGVVLIAVVGLWVLWLLFSLMKTYTLIPMLSL